MAYRFDGSDDRVEFAITPLTGAVCGTSGAATIACFINRTTLSTFDWLVSFTDSGGSSDRVALYATNADILRLFVGSNNDGPSVSSSSIWYLIAVTCHNDGEIRFHVHNGTSWSHSNTFTANTYTVAGTDRVAFGAKPDGSNPFVGDAVCVGIKKSASSDGTIETLSRTAWSAWTGFGFDWLIGFDSSLEAGGILQDQGTAGTGDEIAITGTSAVADPGGWSWGAPAGPAFVPQVIVV